MKQMIKVIIFKVSHYTKAVGVSHQSVCSIVAQTGYFFYEMLTFVASN